MNQLTEETIRLVHGDPDDPILQKEVGQMLETMKKTCPFRIEYRIEPLKREKEGWISQTSNLSFSGKLADTMLETCDRILVLLCTLGYAFEQQLAYEQARSAYRALLWDAAGSVYIEACLDAFETEMKTKMEAQGIYVTDRFSCGYGDLSLDVQSRLVSSFRDIGIRVLESRMMFPTKSVSALIGLSKEPQPARIRGCALCSMGARCPYKKEGEHCGI